MKIPIVAALLFLVTLSSFGSSGEAAAGRQSARPRPFKIQGARLYDASFDADWQRYPPPDVSLTWLRSLFPNVTASSAGYECTGLTTDNRGALGDNNTITGRPVSGQPNTAYVDWYMKCAGNYVKSNQYVLYSASYLDPERKQPRPEAEVRALLEGEFGPLAVTVCETKPSYFKPASLVEAMQMCSWTDFGPEQKKEVIRYQITRLLGPEEVLRDLGVVSNIDDLVTPILNELTAFEAAPTDKYGFLNLNKDYYRARINEQVQIIQFLVLLTDTMRY